MILNNPPFLIHILVRTGITINELEMRLGEGSEISPEGNLFT
jgi:hypothetical protein